MAANHHWGASSLAKRETLHPDLQRFVDELLKRSPTDLRITDGHRDKASQEAAFTARKSRARWGQSPHNRSPSMAVDVVILVNGMVPWNDRAAWDAHGELGLDVARDLGLSITWGGGFSGLYDAPHFELDGWRSVAVPR
jgi:peptidoglycan L-alanyl-D-glutamate endopeptidase CwlK